MNIEFHDPKNDLIGSPIKEPIKEHNSEDEEDDIREAQVDVPCVRHKTFTQAEARHFTETPLF